MRGQAVDYEVLVNHRDEHGVIQDVALHDGISDNEELHRLGLQLMKEFVNEPVVLVNVFEAEETGRKRSRRLRTNTETARVRRHCSLQYIKSRIIGIHQLVVYRGHPRLSPQVVRYSLPR